MYKVTFKIKNQYQKIIVRPEIKSSTSKHHINVPTFISSNLLLTKRYQTNIEIFLIPTYSFVI